MFVSPRRSHVCFVLNVSIVLKQCFPSLAASSASSASKLQNLWFNLSHLKEPSTNHQTLTMTCRNKQKKQRMEFVLSSVEATDRKETLHVVRKQQECEFWELILTPLTTGHSEGTAMLMSPNITCVANLSLSDFFYARRLRRFWVSLPLKTADSAPAPGLG